MGAALATAPTERCIRSWQWVREWEQHPDLYEELRRNALGGAELKARRLARRRMRRYQLPELDGLRWCCKASQSLVEWVALAARWRFSGLMASHAALSSVLGCSASTVPRAIAELVRRDLLIVVRLYELHPEGFRDRGGKLRKKRQLANLYAPGTALLELLSSALKTERAPVAKQGSPKLRSLGSSLSEKNKTRNKPGPGKSQNQRARTNEKRNREPMRVGSLVAGVVSTTLLGHSDAPRHSASRRPLPAQPRRASPASVGDGRREARRSEPAAAPKPDFQRDPERADDPAARACLAALADLFAGRITAGETAARVSVFGDETRKG